MRLRDSGDRKVRQVKEGMSIWCQSDANLCTFYLIPSNRLVPASGHKTTTENINQTCALIILELKDLQIFNETKRKRTENNNHSELVNYVSFADPIT